MISKLYRPPVKTNKIKLADMFILVCNFLDSIFLTTSLQLKHGEQEILIYPIGILLFNCFPANCEFCCLLIIYAKAELQIQ